MPHSRTSRPRWKAAHLDRLGVVGVVELDADHQALAADVADEPGRRASELGAGRPAPARRGPAALATRPPSSSSIVASGRGAGDRVAAVGRAVRARAPRLQERRPGRSSRRGACPRRCPWRSAGCRARRPSARPPTSGRSGRRPTGSRRRSAGSRAGRRCARRPWQEAVLGDDVAALALDRLDDDRRDLVGRDELVEQDLVEPAQVVDLAERRVEDARQERPEAGVVLRLRRGQADRAVRPAVEGAEEGDDVLAAGWRSGPA